MNDRHEPSTDASGTPRPRTVVDCSHLLDNTHGEWTAGTFVTKKKTRPATEVDCSQWVDTSDGTWTFGTFVARKKTRPAVESVLTLPNAEPTVEPRQPATDPADGPLVDTEHQHPLP